MTSHVRISSERRLAGGADDAREVSSLDEYGDQQQNIPLDFVSGGGFIEQSSRAKANFGVDGGVKHGAFWGHPNYIDHGIGLHVKAQHPAYVFINERARDTCGRAQTNLVGEVAFDLRPTDNGDPGRDDIFINLRQNGVIVYTAEGDPGRTLGGLAPEGGNIQPPNKSNAASATPSVCEI